MPSAAPSEAPAAVPMMYGSAIGLRSSAWNTVPAHGQPGADQHGGQDPRQADLEEDRLGAGRPRLGDGRPSSRWAEDRDGVPSPTSTLPSADRGDQQDDEEQAATAQHQRRPGQRDADPSGRVASLGGGGAHQSKASGWMTRARASSPSTIRGPGRVIRSPRARHDRPSTTAVISAQPSRAATVSAVMVGS